MGNKPATSTKPIENNDSLSSPEIDELAKAEADELRTSIPAPAPPISNQVTLADFTVLKQLGRGTFGKVWMVRYKADNMIYAMKIMSKKNIYAENMGKHVRLEKEILATVGNHHPFVVGLRFSFQTPRALCLVIEYLSGGSLFHHLRESEAPYSREVARFYAVEILLALEALHTADFIYRDLKLENCLLDADGHLRLTDFGLSRRLTPRLRRVRSFSGSNIYVAPEVLSDNTQVGHGKTVDWWGYGVLLHLLVTQQAPFWSDNNDELFAMIKEGDPPDFTQYPYLDQDTVSLLSQLLIRDPTQRLGYSESDQGATGAQNVKNHPFFAGVDWVAAAARRLPSPFVPSADYALTHAQIGEGEDDFDITDAELQGTGSADDVEEDLPQFYFQLSMLQPANNMPPPASSNEEPLLLLCRLCGKRVAESQVVAHSAACAASTPQHPENEASSSAPSSSSSSSSPSPSSNNVAPSQPVAPEVVAPEVVTAEVVAEADPASSYVPPVPEDEELPQQEVPEEAASSEVQAPLEDIPLEEHHHHTPPPPLPRDQPHPHHTPPPPLPRDQNPQHYENQSNPVEGDEFGIEATLNLEL